MPVFTLKKYEERSANAATDPDTPSGDNPQDPKEEIVTIHANDSVAKIVANALYKALPNIQEEDSDAAPDTQVVSTEDINASPADTWELVKNTRNIVIVNKGFSTAKEEWFLGNLEASGKKVFFSVESYLRTLGSSDQVAH